MRENDNERYEERAEIMPMPMVEIRAERWPILDILAQDDPRTETFSHLDRETKLRLAPLIDHPNAREEVLAAIHNDTLNFSEQDADAYLALLTDISVVQHERITELLSDQETEVRERETEREEYEQRIGTLMTFFHPKANTTRERTVRILPTNQLLGVKEGYAIPIGDTLAIQSHIKNPDNVDHEFLHAVINPITEKLPLTDEERQHIVAQSSKKLIIDQEYGESPLTLLNETLIRTYVHHYAKGERLTTAEEMRTRISRLDEGAFSAALQQNDNKLKKELDVLGVNSLADFQSRWQEYYDRYIRDDLAEHIYPLYEAYDEERTRDPEQTFEDYLLDHVQDLFKEKEEAGDTD